VCAWIAAAFYVGIVVRETAFWARLYLIAERYHGNVVALVKDGVTDENRAKVLTTIKKHVQTIDGLREKVA
jgi:hypothetical protein